MKEGVGYNEIRHSSEMPHGPSIGKPVHARLMPASKKHRRDNDSRGVVHGAQTSAILDSNNSKLGEDKRRKRRPKKVVTPTEYVVYTNPDKKTHSKPPPDNPCQPGHPARIIIVGKPGCGKRGVMLNILYRYNFDFDTITEVHASAKSDEHDIFEDADDYQLWQWDCTTDGDTDEPYKLIGIPPISRFEKRDENGQKLNNLLIMDEPPCEWNTDMRRKIGTLMNYNSTHNNCTIFLVTQHFQNLPVQIREAATHFVFFPTQNKLQTRFMSSKCGVDLESLFRRFCRNKYDSIMVDMTGDGPRVRRNVYEVIQDGEIKNCLDHVQAKEKKKRKRDGDHSDDEIGEDGPHSSGGRARQYNWDA